MQLDKKILSDIEEREKNLAAREEKVKLAEEASEKQRTHQSKRVKLNIGGTRFETTITTLSAEPDSMLAAMFSGRFPLSPDADGYHFIDRDGTQFALVLNWLRTKTLSESLDRGTLESLAQEADFYQLNQLKRACSQHLSAQTTILRVVSCRPHGTEEERKRLQLAAFQTESQSLTAQGYRLSHVTPTAKQYEGYFPYDMFLMTFTK